MGEGDDCSPLGVDRAVMGRWFQPELPGGAVQCRGSRIPGARAHGRKHCVLRVGGLGATVRRHVGPRLTGGDVKMASTGVRGSLRVLEDQSVFPTDTMALSPLGRGELYDPVNYPGRPRSNGRGLDNTPGSLPLL